MAVVCVVSSSVLSCAAWARVGPNSGAPAAQAAHPDGYAALLKEIYEPAAAAPAPAAPAAEQKK